MRGFIFREAAQENPQASKLVRQICTSLLSYVHHYASQLISVFIMVLIRILDASNDSSWLWFLPIREVQKVTHMCFISFSTGGPKGARGPFVKAEKLHAVHHNSSASP